MITAPWEVVKLSQAIMENFHNKVGLHHLFEAIAEWINGLQIDDEAFVCEEYLD